MGRLDQSLGVAVLVMRTDAGKTLMLMQDL
jgi:hypothetical protein